MHPDHKTYQARLTHLQKILNQQSIDCYLISSPSKISYLTGIKPSLIHREAFLVVASNQNVLFTSPLIASGAIFKSIKVILMNKSGLISSYLKKNGFSTIYYEANNLLAGELDQLQNKSNKSFKSAKNWIEILRQTKDQSEINLISTACQITYQTWLQIEPQIKAGKTEIEIAELIRSTLINNGADGIPLEFQPIVATGKNSATPHHQPSHQVIQSEDVVLIDFGCQVRGYHSDFTRTIKLDRKSNQFIHIGSTVNKSFHQALKAIASNQSIKKIDAIIRQTIIKAGYPNLPHATGHGIGLSVHELPCFSPKSPPNDKLKENMVIAIEPAIYLEDQFGYRHEDTILITKTGYQLLTQ